MVASPETCLYSIEMEKMSAGQLEQANRQHSDQAAALAAQESLFEQLSSSQTRLQRHLELITKERDSLKQVVTLYQENAGPQASTTGEDLDDILLH